MDGTSCKACPMGRLPRAQAQGTLRLSPELHNMAAKAAHVRVHGQKPTVDALRHEGGAGEPGDDQGGHPACTQVHTG